MELRIEIKNQKNYHIQNVYIIEFLPIAMTNYITGGIDIRDYIGKYLSKETFNKIESFVDKETKKIEKELELETYNDGLKAYHKTRWAFSKYFILTNNSNGETYIQAGGFRIIDNAISVLDVEVFNDVIY